MIKKGIIFLLVMVLMAALNMGLMEKKLSMAFIKAPSVMMMMGNQHEKQMIELNSKLQALQASNGSQSDQDALSSQLQQISQADAVNITDVKFISTLINDIKKSKGIINERKIIRPENQRIYIIQFGFDNLSQSTEEEFLKNVKDGYFPSMYLFPDNLALMPTISPSDKTKIATVEVKLSDATYKYLIDYYNKNIKKL